MGGCNSRNDPESMKSKIIDTELKKQASTLHNQVKLLLLGPGESGKSTIFKQMRIIQDRGGFSQDELIAFKSVIYGNCMSQMKALVNAATNLQIPLEEQQSREAAERLLQLYNQGSNWSVEAGRLVKLLWQDKGIGKVYLLRGKKYQLNDTASYFFDSVDRISQESYIPTVDDVLRARVRSTGIEEAEFTFEQLTLTMVDVGGQRSERRKWIHCFDNVTAILFCAAISEYNQTLREDQSQNRLAEAMLLFEEVSNSHHFTHTSLILFLNKVDIFDDKILVAPLLDCFPEYSGQTPDDAKSYIKSKFLEKAQQDVYTHYTCALSTKNIAVVINSVRDKLLKVDLVQSGLPL